MKRKQFVLAVLLFSATALCIIACKKQESNNTPAEVKKIEQLAVKFTQPIDQSYNAVIAQYSSLSTAELNKFWIEVNKINRHMATLTSKEETDIINWVADINKKSIDSYGKTFNKLNGTQIQDIFFKGANKQQGNVTVMRPPVDPPPGECQLFSYPLLFYPNPNGTPSPAAVTFVDVKDAQVNTNSPWYPCEAVEYWYTGTTWGSMYPLTPLAAACMGYLGGWGWLVRKDGGYTKVFAPKVFVIGWFGSLAAFNDNVRVTNYLVEQ